MARSMQMLRGTAAEWAADDIVVPSGELALLVDGAGLVLELRIGNGAAVFSALTAFQTVPKAHSHVTGDVTGLTAALAGKEAAGTAAGAVSAHEGAANPHPAYLTQAEADVLYLGGGVADGSISTVHLGGDITAAGKALLDDATTAAQRGTLGLGSVDNTSDANKPVSTAQATAIGLKLDAAAVSAFGLTLIDDASAGTARGTLGLGSAATTATTDYAAAAHGHSEVTTGAAGFMSAADKVKLDGIAPGATANSADATLLARGNHTGTQAAGTITGLATVATSGSAADLTGNLPVARLAGGTGASATSFWRGDGQWATPDGGGGGGSYGPHALEPDLSTGKYLTSVVNGLALTTLAQAANRLDYVPFRPSRSITINELAIEVSTLIAGSQARVGVYSATAAGLPNALLTGQGSLLDCASTGVKVSAVSPSLTLTAGTQYFLAVLSSSTQTLRAIALGGLLPLGYAGSSTALQSLYRATNTFASGLPATAAGLTATSSIAPMVRLKIA